MTLKFQSKLRRWLWSFNANFKGKFEVLVETSKRFWTLIETSKGVWSFHWNYKEAFEVCFEISKSPFEVYFEISKQTSKVVWSLPWNFKANFKGICFICLFFNIFSKIWWIFSILRPFFLEAKKKTQHAKAQGCIQIEECIARWFAQAKLLGKLEVRNVETYSYKRDKHQHFTICG